MIIVSNGTLSCYCPDCGTLLKHRDFKLRIMKKEGGTRHFIQIERLKCNSCHRLHNALPDILVPYKHYTAEIISGVLDETVSSNDLDAEDYPCEETMKRWHHWLMANQEYINGYIKSLEYRRLGFHENLLNCQVSSLSRLRKSKKSWLEAILRVIYNSGGFLVPV